MRLHLLCVGLEIYEDGLELRTSTVEVVFPRAFLGPDSSTFSALAALLLCSYLVYSFSFHYFMAACLSPGTPSDPIGFRPPTPSLRTAMYRLLRLGRQGKQHPNLRPTKLATVDRAEVPARRANGQARVCKKCPTTDDVPPVKPERTHHCRSKATF